jgi:2'-hydroxyisoflavone reductase
MKGNSTLHWVDDQTLLDEGVGPWMELPLWMPGAEWAGLMEVDVSRAIAAGLRFRPLEETARDTLAWSLEAGEQRETLPRERERAILQAH